MNRERFLIVCQPAIPLFLVVFKGWENRVPSGSAGILGGGVKQQLVVRLIIASDL